MIKFSIAQFTDQTPGGQYANAAAVVLRIMDVVASILNTSIVSAANANVTLALTITPSSGLGSASAGAAYSGTWAAAADGTLIPKQLVNAAVYKIATGESALLPGWSDSDMTGNMRSDVADGVLTITADYLELMLAKYGSPSSSIGANDYLVNGLLHETLHMLGFDGGLNWYTGSYTVPGYDQFWTHPFDKHVRVEGTEVSFHGPLAMAIYGGAVPLRDLDNVGATPIYHLEVINKPDDVTVIVGEYNGPETDLMSGWTTDGMQISDLDLAILADTGVRNLRTLVSVDGHTFIPGAGLVSVSGTTSPAHDTLFLDGALGEFDVYRGADGLVRVAERAAPANTATISDIELVRFSDLRFSAAGIGTKSDDVIVGTGAAAETFFGGAGNDSIHGMAGVDAAVYSSSMSSYSITRTPTGFVVTDKTGVEGVDVLEGIERLWFADKQIAFDIDGNAGDIYRLYQAAFDRVPDSGGLSFWMNGVDAGMSLADISAFFMTSSEFTGMYGANPTNHSMLTKFYEHVLHRAPEQAGFDWWLEKMNEGIPAHLVLQSFADSAENQQQVSASIVGGIEYAPWG